MNIAMVLKFLIKKMSHIHVYNILNKLYFILKPFFFFQLLI